MNSPTPSTPKAFGVNNALAGTPTNCNTVATLSLTVSNPPTFTPNDFGA